MARITTAAKIAGTSTTLADDFNTLKAGINALYPVAQQLTNEITFAESGYGDAIVSQTGPISFTLSASGHSDGIVKRLRLISDGVNPITFPADWIVYVSGWEGGTSGTINAGTYSVWMVYIGGDVEVNIPGAVGVATVVNTAPTITLAGANPYTMTEGGTYTEPGYTATDAEDGDITANVVVSGTVNTATAGTYTKTYTVTDAGGLQAQVTRTVQVNAVSNTAPTANAGADQTITAGNTLTLTGSGSDSDGTIASYAWSKVSGGAATITSPTAATTTVTGLVQGAYVFRLTVTDNSGATATDDVTVQVNAAAPTTVDPLTLSPVMWQKASAVNTSDATQVHDVAGTKYVDKLTDATANNWTLTKASIADNMELVDAGLGSAHVMGGVNPIFHTGTKLLEDFGRASFEEHLFVDITDGRPSLAQTILSEAYNATATHLYNVMVTSTGILKVQLKENNILSFYDSSGRFADGFTGKVMITAVVDWGARTLVAYVNNDLLRTPENYGEPAKPMDAQVAANWSPGKLHVMGRNPAAPTQTPFLGNLYHHLITRLLTNTERGQLYNYFLANS